MLFDDVAYIESALANHGAVTRLDEDEVALADPEAIALHHLRHDLRLAGRALSLLANALRRHRAAAERFMSGASLPDGDRLRAHERMDEAALEVELHVRALYELLYAIQLLAARVKTEPFVLTEGEANELSRCAMYRGSLLVHRERAARFTRGARMWDADGHNIRFGIGLQPISEADAQQLGAVFKRIGPALPPDIRSETNWNERLQHLYEQWDRVPSEERKLVKHLIGKYSVKSDPPAVLARLVRTLVERYFHEQAPSA